jgi:hypothetical protein
MRSSDDELNDAIKNALKAELGNFERKPKASLDERIYIELGQKPNRKPLWAALSIAAFLGLAVFWYVSDKDRNVIGKTKIVAGNAKQKPAGEQDKATFGQVKDKVNKRDNVISIAAKAPSEPTTENRTLKGQTKTPKAKTRFENQQKATQLESTFSNPTREPENREDYIGDDNGLAGESDQQNNFFDYNNDAYHIEKLDLLNAAKYPTVPLPLITLPILQDKTDSVETEITEKKPASSWKPAMLVNVSLTNTSQRVYLLPSTHSRVLKVSFPNSVANIGYKMGLGMQVKGYQLLVNYSHLQYQTEYLYALKEFAAEPANASYRFKRLGTARTVKSAFDIIGVAAKKNIDFETKALGALYAQLGMEYSRSVMGSNQQLLSASASAGKRIYAGPKASIVIGPFFEYNILRIATSEENVKIRPNQVGISLGLGFGN